MSIIVSGIALPFAQGDEAAIAAAGERLGVNARELPAAVIRRSFDLRRGTLKKVFSVALDLPSEERERRLVEQRNDPNIRFRPPLRWPQPTGRERLSHPPVVVGFGPAGIFAAYLLAKNGYRPLVLERGGSMDERDEAVGRFFVSGRLDPGSNLQFGEGGAGTYSDGKLTTRIDDPRCRMVMDAFARFGAEEAGLLWAKPHVGTDRLKRIVVALREQIISWGGEVRFNTPIRDIRTKMGTIEGISTAGGEIPAQTAILATGHSARDVYRMLGERGVALERKGFSVGVRVEHLQSDIDEALYGRFAGTEGLPPGEYGLSCHIEGRGCYSFCMCPGGQVVAAASEEGGVVTNGMSHYARDGRNANSALCVSVGPEDLPGGELFAGVAFQRELERAAFLAGGGEYRAPVQRVDDFLAGRKTAALGRVEPSYSRGWSGADLTGLLPRFVADTLAASLPVFGGKLAAFSRGDAVLTGVETRTSSPLRVLRNGELESSIAGLIPCGEGAGYAGGIMSAAVDGLKAAEQIMSRYAPMD